MTDGTSLFFYYASTDGQAWKVIVLFLNQLLSHIYSIYTARSLPVSCRHDRNNLGEGRGRIEIGFILYFKIKTCKLATLKLHIVMSATNVNTAFVRINYYGGSHLENYAFQMFK